MTDLGITSDKLLSNYLTNVTNILHNISLQKQMPHPVHNIKRFYNVDQLDMDAIFEFTYSYDVTAVIEKWHYILQSSSWRVDEMHPGGRDYYFFADT